MKKTKKFISLLLAVMLVFSCFTGVAAFTASAEDEVEDVYSVFGSSAEVFGGVWFKENPLTEMTLDESDGLYKITFKDVEPTNMLQLKVLKNHDEEFSWGAPNSDQNYTVNITQTCDVTVTFDPVQELVNVVGDYVEVPQGLKVDHVIAAGNGEDTYLNGANWDPSDPSNEMIEMEPGVWVMTMEDIYSFDNYQIKFAANSVDDDGNPSSNPWATNWGSAEEKLYPTGEWIDATYNGKNCIFEVEDDESIVRVVLDLRNFDYATKTGARFKITINPEEDEPYVDDDQPTQPVTQEPTDAPEPTVAPTTAAPEPTVAPTTVPTPVTKALTVKSTSNLFASAVRSYSELPGTVTVVYYADITSLRLQDFQGTLTYDPNVLSVDEKKNGDYDDEMEVYDLNPMMPVAGGLADVNYAEPGKIIFAVAKWDGMRLTKNGELVPIIKAVFDVAPTASGTTTVNLGFGSISFVNPKTEDEYHPYTNAYGFNQTDYNAVVGTDGVLGSYVDEPSDEEVPTDAPETTAPVTQPVTQPSTTAPVPEPTATQPTPTNPNPGTGLTVNAVSNLWNTATKTYSETPDTVTVTYFADISVSTIRLQNIQFAVKYDKNYLTIDKAKNGVYDEDIEDYDYSQSFPVAAGVGDENFDLDSQVKFAVTKWDGLRLSKNGELIPIATIVFDVVPGATGTTNVEMEFGVITFMDAKTEAEYIVHSNAYGLDQTNYDYITSIGELRTIVDDEIETLPAKAATCTESGLTEGKRNTVTGEIIVPQQVIPALGHATVIDPAVPVTCTVDGKTQGSHCSRCGEVLVAQEVIKAKGHQNVSVSRVEPTCTEPGHTAGLKCSVCGITIMGITEIPAKGHTPVNVAAIAATCTRAGHTAGTRCSVCNEILSGNVEKPALDHDIIIKPGRAATYTQTGLTEGQFCNRCKKWIVMQTTIPKLVSDKEYGDVNRDGIVNVLDAIMIQKAAVDKATLDDEQKYLGDVNGDGKVDVIDASLIQKFAGERINKFPVEK
ncbi:MAG: dockerin type I domain-containing protein [Ruminococcus sp.]|nr:dockerin type I domain-containing protein [Ruminococcus sp.]